MINNEIRYIAEKTIYCCLATINDDGTPWASPLFFGYDESLNIYWRSAVNSRHSQNIERQPDVSIVIYDSNSNWGEGKGLYMKGRAEIVEGNESNVQNALRHLDRRSNKKTQQSELLGDSPRRVYKFTPSSIWVNKSLPKDGALIGVRDEVTI